MRRTFRALAGCSLLLSGVSAVSFATAAGASSPSCASITKSLVVADGYSGATGPKVTAYNYAKPNANATNALGTTIDFGAKALVVGCLSPSAIAKLSVAAQGSMKPAMTAQQYMNYMVKQSQGAMSKTLVGGVNDYLDFGSGKEDGLGSTVKDSSVRLDAWIAGKYIFLGFSGPVTSNKPSAALVHFIASTERLF